MSACDIENHNNGHCIATWQLFYCLLLSSHHSWLSINSFISVALAMWCRRACICCLSEEEKRSIAVDKQIKKILKEQKKKERREIKILLLGQYCTQSISHSCLGHLWQLAVWGLEKPSLSHHWLNKSKRHWMILISEEEHPAYKLNCLACLVACSSVRKLCEACVTMWVCKEWPRLGLVIVSPQKLETQPRNLQAYFTAGLMSLDRIFSSSSFALMLLWGQKGPSWGCWGYKWALKSRTKCWNWSRHRYLNLGN